ncbi:hypothetical protein OHS59_19500 [Streptomyces sp. NBC_00414]|uniref:hypothetical protein n=1 Tax=Streptomyces sp. NBC_00414 TaxID=2975739 RepID=UPI002E1D3AAC
MTLAIAVLIPVDALLVMWMTSWLERVGLSKGASAALAVGIVTITALAQWVGVTTALGGLVYRGPGHTYKSAWLWTIAPTLCAFVFPWAAGLAVWPTATALSIAVFIVMAVVQRRSIEGFERRRFSSGPVLLVDFRHAAKAISLIRQELRRSDLAPMAWARLLGNLVVAYACRAALRGESESEAKAELDVLVDSLLTPDSDPDVAREVVVALREAIEMQAGITLNPYIYDSLTGTDHDPESPGRQRRGVLQDLAERGSLPWALWHEAAGDRELHLSNTLQPGSGDEAALRRLQNATRYYHAAVADTPSAAPCRLDRQAKEITTCAWSRLAEHSSGAQAGDVSAIRSGLDAVDGALSKLRDLLAERSFPDIWLVGARSSLVMLLTRRVEWVHQFGRYIDAGRGFPEREVQDLHEAEALAHKIRKTAPVHAELGSGLLYGITRLRREMGA